MLFKPEDHAANGPETWLVVKATDRIWHLRTKDGGVLQSCSTKREAEALRTSGFYVNLYERERRWYGGELIPGLRPVLDVFPDLAARLVQV